ncbi:MAG TPA: hypothetical protein VMW62_07025, partial [Chloroflexota bacterium]|nr:hypothetical protein [Chloroflexota bacterium]
MAPTATACSTLPAACWPGARLTTGLPLPDGYRTWVIGPAGVQQRLNTERFPFEHDQLGQADLKLRLLDAFGPLLYCDPDFDFYPVARADEQALALARFPHIQADATMYQAILAHEHLASGGLTDSDKLAIYHDYKQLNALP